jgi:hypothetical protein
MVSWKLKIAACLSALIVPMLFTTPAHAGVSLYSNKAYYGPVNGISYWNQSIVSTNIIMESAYTVARNGSGTIPGGWSGGQSSVYRNGALCASSSLYYNPDVTSGWTGLGGHKNCGTGTYNARGSTAAYNGNGYNYYYTATSPNYNY